MAKRLDVLLVEKGLVVSRTKAQALILSGDVLVNDQPVTKSGTLIDESSEIRIRRKEHDYVSRGALKLNAALDAFAVPVEGRVALDVGASTGGFTEVLLERGASKVHAVDVGHNQLSWKIRSDSRVHVLEKVNARELKLEQLGQKVDLVVMDVSFISQTKILPALKELVTPDGSWITLIKPQFELSPSEIDRGGIVTRAESRSKAVESVTAAALALGLDRLGLIESPIKGTDGNQEYLAHWKRKC